MKPENGFVMSQTCYRLELLFYPLKVIANDNWNYNWLHPLKYTAVVFYMNFPFPVSALWTTLRYHWLLWLLPTRLYKVKQRSWVGKHDGSQTDELSKQELVCYVSLISLLCLSILLAFRVSKEILSSTKLNIVHEYKAFLPIEQRLSFIQCKWRIVTKFYCSWIWKALAYLCGFSNFILCLLGFSFSPKPLLKCFDI